MLDHLVEEELISEPDPSDTMRGQHLLELKRLEYQERDRERETQLRMKELELKEKEITMQLRLRELEARPTGQLTSISFILKRLPQAWNGHERFGPYYCKVCWWERLGRFTQLCLWR